MEWTAADLLALVNLTILCLIAWGSFARRQGTDDAATKAELAALQKRIDETTNEVDALERQFNNIDDWPHGLMLRLAEAFVPRGQCQRRKHGREDERPDRP